MINNYNKKKILHKVLKLTNFINFKNIKYIIF